MRHDNDTLPHNGDEKYQVKQQDSSFNRSSNTITKLNCDRIEYFSQHLTFKPSS